MSFIMMNFNQSNQSFADGVNQQNYQTDNLHTDQPSLSPPKKRQRTAKATYNNELIISMNRHKSPIFNGITTVSDHASYRPPTQSSKTSTQKSTHNNELKISIDRHKSSIFNGITPVSDHAPYRHPTQSSWYGPPQGQHPSTMQATQNTIPMQLNRMNPWNLLVPSFPTSSTAPYANTQFSQNRQNIPTVHNPMSSTFYGNQSSLWQNPLSASPGMFPYTTTIQSSGPMAPNAFQQPHFGPLYPSTTSAFQMYQRPSNCDILRFHSESPGTATSSNESPTSIYDFESAISSLNEKVIDSTEKETNSQENQRVNSEYEKSVGTSNSTTEKFDFICIICRDNKKDTVLIPCRHLCVCQKCSKNIDLCPICRNKCDTVMTVFYT